MFAMLVGGDYDRQGLKGCGTVNALKLVKAGLGRSLCSRQGQTECNIWRESVLKRFIARQSINLVVPGDYPKFNTLDKYKSPDAHADAELRNHARANWNYGSPLLEVKLLRVACRRFNFWSEQYYDHISPVLLSRFLAERDRSLSREIVHEISS